MRTTFVFMLLVSLLAGVAMAADVSGKWTAKMPGRNGGPEREIAFNLKAEGSTLTGSISGQGPNAVDITNGKVDGDKVSFTVKTTRGDNTMISNYKGKVEGDSLKLTMSREGADQTREIVAKRAN